MYAQIYFHRLFKSPESRRCDKADRIQQTRCLIYRNNPRTTHTPNLKGNNHGRDQDVTPTQTAVMAAQQCNNNNNKQ
jgi:hypothetical protein